MIFNSSYTKAEIESLTYRELLEVVKLFYRLDAEKLLEFFILFGTYNLESTAIASNGKKADMTSYLRNLQKRKIDFDVVEKKESTIENQFEGVDFG